VIKRSWISTKEASILLEVSQRTIQNWVDSGKIKANLTIGGHRRLSRADVIKHLPSIRPILSDDSIDFSSVTDNTVLRVLVIEDDYALLRLCELQFEKFIIPHNLHLATNAFHGLLMIGKYQPHLIFTDLNMPHIDGICMINKIINLPELKGTRIVVITGMEALDIDKLGTIPDGVMVLPKPIPFKTVETILYQVANVLTLANNKTSNAF
jgi:excisionase family DNA binding protein